MTEYFLELEGLPFAFADDTLAGVHVEFPRGVPSDGVFLGRLVTFAFHRVKMEQFRTLKIFQLTQHTDDFNHIVPVSRTEITDIHTLEHVLLTCQNRLQTVIEADNRLPTLLIEHTPVEQLLRGTITQIIISGIGTGYGAGLNSVISRFVSIGKNEDADNAIMHIVILAVLSYLIFLVIGIFFLDSIIIFLGGASVSSLCKAYIMPAFMLNIFLMAPEINAGLYRSRGDVKRSSDSFIVIAILNMILDPIFIYILNLGISGASYSTIIALICGLIYMNIGQDFRKNIIIPVKQNFKFQLSLLKELLSRLDRFFCILELQEYANKYTTYYRY